MCAQARDRQRLEELSTLHSAHLHAACAAARTSAQGAAAAKDAATAAFSAEWEPVRRERRAAALANAGSDVSRDAFAAPASLLTAEHA